jgi:hypothetical protein
MKDRTFKINSFDQIIELGTKFEMNWFRGQSKLFGDLTPAIFRPYIWNEIALAFNVEIEQSYYSKFIRKVSSYSTNLPESTNYLEWLFLMQHHGLPTRLLDWSENILVATFFAVNENPNEDAELWSLLPWKLNEIHGFWGLPYPNNKILKFLSSEMFHNNPTELAKELGLSITPNSPMAILPVLKHPRMTGQQSCFTIHPKPDNCNKIPDLIKEENMLTRYIIPKDLKSQFIRHLNSLGISYCTLFPDLEGLTKSIKEENKTIGWGQPQLPNYEHWTKT